jgi:hypothetical protein
MDIAAIFNDWPTRTMKINIQILAVMYSDLPGSNNDYTILHSSDMSSTSYMTSYDQRAFYIPQGKSSKRGAVSCWNRHIHNASVKSSDGA